MRRSQDYAVYVATQIDRWIFWGTLLGFNIGELGWAAWQAGSVLDLVPRSHRRLCHRPLGLVVRIRPSELLLFPCHAAAVVLIPAIQSQIQPQPLTG